MARITSKQIPLISALDFCAGEYPGVSGYIAGLDEVGRGPLVGAVVAAAVILPKRHAITGLKDSKKIAETKRPLIAEEIRQKSVAWAIGRAEADEIDRINILQASLLAMTRAIEALSTEPDFALVDGNRLPHLPCDGAPVVKGDGRVEEIAAASILAKVARDEEMLALDARYPHYGFARHKGYPTALHLQMLGQYGVLSEHRRSFGPVRKILEADQST